MPVDLVADVDPKDRVEEVPVEVKLSDEGETVVPAPPVEKVTLFSVSSGIPDDYTPLDIGNETINIFVDVISQAKTILFKGVVSKFYTYEEYQKGSKGGLLICPCLTAIVMVWQNCHGKFSQSFKLFQLSTCFHTLQSHFLRYTVSGLRKDLIRLRISLLLLGKVVLYLTTLRHNALSCLKKYFMFYVPLCMFLGSQIFSDAYECQARLS